MVTITLRDVTKRFPSRLASRDPIEVLAGFDLHIATGGFLGIAGPNGCGKTTLLRLIAGLERPDGGTVEMRPGLRRGELGYVFQDYRSSLLPWLTGLQNIMLPFALGRGDSTRAHISPAARTLLGRFESKLPLDQYPYQLSSGEAQIVAILRSLVYEPPLLLLDEPFAALDGEYKRLMLSLLQEHWARTRATVLCVAHNLDELLLLADRILVLTDRPARVTVDRNVDFPRPREVQLAASREFGDLRRAVLEESSAAVL